MEILRRDKPTTKIWCKQGLHRSPIIAIILCYVFGYSVKAIGTHAYPEDKNVKRRL